MTPKEKAKIDRFDMVNNPGDGKPSMTIWFSGCSMGCPNYHNPRLQTSKTSDWINVKTVVDDINSQCERFGISTIVLLGGELLS